MGPCFRRDDDRVYFNDHSPFLPHRSRHRRLARHRLCHRARAGKGRRPCDRGGANAGAGSKNSTMKFALRRRHRDPGAAQSDRFRWHRPAWRGAAGTPRQARHSRRQCRRRRSLLAARAYRAEVVERRDGDQRVGQLPVDPLHGAAAEEVRRRPRGVRHLGGGEPGQRLSRPLCRLEGSAGDAGASLGAGNRDNAAARQPVQSRPDTDADACDRISRRRPADAGARRNRSPN